MDWSKGFSASYYMTIVDPASWRDVERVEIKDGKIVRKATGLQQSADVTCTDFSPDRERWVRLWLVASQDGDVARVPLFTGLSSVPECNIDGYRKQYPLACYSVLKPAEDILLDRGWYAFKGRIGGDIIAELFSSLPAPVEIEENSPALTQTIIAENGETCLSMANKILTAINWRFRISGDGTITICPKATEISGLFGEDYDVIEPRITTKADWFQCPNVFRAVSGDNTAIAIDDSEDSMLSTVTRGREIWREDTSCRLNDNEGLEQYAKRRLAEEQAYAYSIRYQRRFHPDVNVGDLVRLHYPGANLMDVYTVMSQNITLGHGARVSEEVQK